MALWMDAGAAPTTEKEMADLEAIASLKESAAIELKVHLFNSVTFLSPAQVSNRSLYAIQEQGNEFVKMGKKHYNDAIDCYTRAINQKALSNSDQSVLFANRAHVNLLLGNYRRALEDAEEAIQLSSTNVKAYYRAAKAAFSLNLLTQASSFCQWGLEHFPANEELNKLLLQAELRVKEEENLKAKVSTAVNAAKDIAYAMEKRGLKIGRAMYQELTGLRKPALDKNQVLHWPVLFLYAEVLSSDFIEDFCESDLFTSHLDMMFSESSQSLPWDTSNSYTREAIELYYQASTGTLLSKKEVLKSLLEGTAHSPLDDLFEEEKDSGQKCLVSPMSMNSGKWIKVNEKKTLLDVLQQPNYIIPGIPVFFVVSKNSRFYKEFKTGNWSPP